MNKKSGLTMVSIVIYVVIFFALAMIISGVTMVMDSNSLKDKGIIFCEEQLNKLQEAKESIENIKIGLEKEEPIDIIEIDIKNIWNILGEITGESYTEELLDNLFSDFCVGK